MVYFDGACGMCRRSVRWLRRLDWLGRLEAADSTSLKDDELPVSRERSLEGMPMRTRSGRVLVGFPAVRRALLQTPLGALPAIALYLPGVSHLGDRCYREIARRRSRETCAPDSVGQGQSSS